MTRERDSKGRFKRRTRRNMIHWTKEAQQHAAAQIKKAEQARKSKGK